MFKIFIQIGFFTSIFMFIEFYFTNSYFENSKMFGKQFSYSEKNNFNTLLEDEITAGFVIFIIDILIVFGYCIVEEVPLKFFFDVSFFVSLICTIFLIILRYFKYFKGENYLILKYEYETKKRLKEVSILIDSLNERISILKNYHVDDKYRSEDLISSEIDELYKSIALLKRIYSYIELNMSNTKVKKGLGILKKTKMADVDFKKFEKELDTINAKIDLNCNIDSYIEDLKKKFN